MVNVVDNTEENKKRVFFQAALLILKGILKKLVQDESLLREMMEKWAAAEKSARAQASLDTWERLFLDMLKEIEQKLKVKFEPFINLISEKLKLVLTNALQHIHNLSLLKAEFAEKELDIVNRISGIDTTLSRIEDSLAAPVIIPPVLTALATEVAGVRKKVNVAHGIVDDLLSRFNEASTSIETSRQELSELRDSRVNTQRLNSDPIDTLLEEIFSPANISVKLEVDALRRHKASLIAFDFRIGTIETTIQARALPYNLNLFLKAPRSDERTQRQHHQPIQYFGV